MFISLANSMRKPASLRPQSRPPAPENSETACTPLRASRPKTIRSTTQIKTPKKQHGPGPKSKSPDVLIDGIFFYDVAEGLMAMYTHGEFSIRYKARRAETSRVKEMLEEVGIVKNNVLTGLGQMAAKSLLHYVARRGITVEGIYLSALIAFTLFAEMRNFRSSGREVLMEAAARHKRLTDVVREWLQTSPKLYQRDLLLFYEWEDAVKDFAITRAEKKEDFRFLI